MNTDTYLIDGISFPRVTRIINTVLNKQALNDWRARVGEEQASDMSEELAEIGTQVHGFIRDIIGGYSFNSTPAEVLRWAQLDRRIRNGLKAYQQCQMTLKFKPVQSEILLVSKAYGYAGTADCIAKIGRQYWLLDWKVSERLWEEVEFQLAAYWHAHNEMGGVKLAGCRAIRLDRETGIWNPDKDQLIMFPQDLERAFDAFKSILNIFNYRRDKCTK